MFLSFLFVGFIVKVQFLTVCSVSPKDAVHVGCFSAKFATSNDYYKVRQALPWEQGVLVCVERLTTYVGVQAEPGSSDDNFFFCGNELLDHSERVNSSECQPCFEDGKRYCGGVETMSLYRLRNATPLQLLLATGSSGVREWTDDNSPTPVKISYANSVTDVDYLYANDDIYFSYSSYMYRSFYKYTTSKFSSPSIGFSASYLISSMAVDWESRKLYGGRSGDYNVYETDTRGQHFRVIADRNNYIRDLAVDPYTRKVFFVENPGNLLCLSLDNGNVSSHLEFGNLYMSDILRITVDVNEQFIYLVGKVIEDNEYHLVRTDYNDHASKILLNGTSLSDVRAVDVFNGTLVWINYANNQYTVYKCKLTPKCREYHAIYQSAEGLYDVKIYHPEKQTPGRKYLCDRLNCSHGCVKTSLFVAKCSCPAGKHLGQDEATCIERPTTTTMLNEKEDDSKNTTVFNKEHKHQGQLTKPTLNNDKMAKQTMSTSAEDSKEEKTARLLEHLHGLMYRANFNHTSKPREEETTEVRSKVTFSEVFLSIVAFLVLILLATVIYILVKFYRSIDDRGIFIGSKPTELTELNGYLDSTDCSGKPGFEIKLIK